MDKRNLLPTTARRLAAELLARVRPTGPFISDLFDELAEAARLDARDRHLAYELATGVVRHGRTLDCAVNAFARRPVAKSPPPLRVVMRLGAFQLLFLDRVPDHAAVDTTVELAKEWAAGRMKKPPAPIAGYVNGLLRALAAGRSRADSARGQDPCRLIERPGADTFVLLERDVFASPHDSPSRFLGEAYSFDDWLAERWVARFGLHRAVELARAQNRRPGLAVRVNTLRADIEDVRRMLAADGVRTGASRLGRGLLRVTDGDALDSRAMTMGLIQPQDAWVATIAEQLDVRAGMTVLDRCAAPGTKTVQIGQLMNDNGHIIAVDVRREGLDDVRTAARRAGCHIIETVLADDMPRRLMQVGRIDRVLVDVPCSNSGVLARRPEARWRISGDQVEQCSTLQRELLMDALNWAAPGGRVVYATCSIEPEENELVVQYAVSRRRGQARLVRDRLTLPSLADDHDGGYWAVLERVR